MPELPEVQTIVNDLNRKIAGRRIIAVWTDWPKSIKDPFGRFKNISAAEAAFKKEIKSRRIVNVRRRAKNILFYLSGDYILLIHLKMTGHLILGKWKISGGKVIPVEPRAAVSDPYNRFIHMIFYFDRGDMLGFSDVRKFGKVILGPVGKMEKLEELVKLGPEPLDKNFKFGEFKEIISRENGRIKQVLMNPEVIAGIGNIYSDDILFAAKIHPFRRANRLSPAELKKLFAVMKNILKKALQLRGTSISDYRDVSGKEGYYADYRLVYQREGEKCQRCGGTIKRIKIGGRSAHFCPGCQKL